MNHRTIALALIVTCFTAIPAQARFLQMQQQYGYVQNRPPAISPTATIQHVGVRPVTATITPGQTVQPAVQITTSRPSLGPVAQFQSQPPQLQQYADGMNLYQYCGSDPANYVDPWGLIKKYICCTPSQITILNKDEALAQSEINKLKTSINQAIAADVGQYPWFTNYRLKNARKTLNQASAKLTSCTVKCTKKKDARASANPWGNTVWIHIPYWTQSGIYRAGTLVHEGTHMGTATTDAAYFLNEGTSPHDVLLIGWDSIASTYKWWLVKGFCIPGHNCP